MDTLSALAIAALASGCAQLLDIHDRSASAGGGGSGGSCASLAATCGSAGSDDCCTSLLVPGGTFELGTDVATDGMFPHTNVTTTIHDFRLDKYEVTVGRFRAFVASGAWSQAGAPSAGAGANPSVSGSGWNSQWNQSLVVTLVDLDQALFGCGDATWSTFVAGEESRPINCVSWYEAMAFCAWDGGFLPSEAEWNYAAAGGDQQRAYPFSSPAYSVTIDPTEASYNCMGDGMAACSFDDLLVVGSDPTGDGMWQHSDLAGNVGEWVLDFYATPYPETSCDDCANLTDSGMRVTRGGGYTDAATVLRTGARGMLAPDGRARAVGVRCARAP
ncbi:MAG TPA: formylglycine-generating enzyme family protein [Kofleriaceae bacterium]|nr:formylglycine-generating enzyme family protein [Kofleriaceae bacterium]